MRSITLSEKDFNAIFDRVEKEYQYDHEFMKGDERLDDFKASLRYHHLMRFRATLKGLKERIISA